LATVRCRDFGPWPAILPLQSFSEPDFQESDGFSKVQNFVDILLQVMLEDEGFRVRNGRELKLLGTFKTP